MKEALPPLIYPDSRILILGSMPGEKSLGEKQYYANKGNHFWKLMFTVFREPFSTDYKERKMLLRRHRIALWDVLAYCEREGSLDSKIRNEQANDFDGFFKQHPQLTHVYFSSKAAAAYYDKYAKHQENVKYAVLPSPSGANAGKNFAQKLEAWEVLYNLSL
ncbi:MAG TPA: DNA-deoxyinosine glycosylase [Flavobacterium sp.]|jgi:hypoxanthine-DNA glycosylase